MIGTGKSTDDVRVIITYAILVIVFVVKLEEKAMFANEVEHIIMK